MGLYLVFAGQTESSSRHIGIELMPQA